MKSTKLPIQSVVYEEGEAAGRAEGQAEGSAKTILAVLEARGLAVSDEVRSRIKSCTDAGKLEVWARRAATVETAGELFG